MKFLNNVLMGVLFFCFVQTSAFALKTDFKTVSEYHQNEIEQLLKDYTLEESLTIRIELKKKDNVNPEQEVVSLPGLYQKTGEAPDSNIEEVLNSYTRKVVFIKKREISEQELDLVKSSLKERLFLPDDVQITMLDDTKKIDEAVQNIKTDFVFGAYNTLIKNGQFLWILIFSVGFIIALWVLAKVWKAKSESAGGEISMAGGGAGMGAEASASSHDDHDGGAHGALSLNSSEFETFNFGSLCQNINDAYKKSPGTTAHIIWEQISDLQSQIQFYEILRIQNQVSHDIMNETNRVIDEVFSFNTRAATVRNVRGKGFSKNTLSLISVELAKLKFIEPHDKIEDAYSALYPKKADFLKEVYARGLDEHYMVLYKLFKDDFMNYISSLEDSNVLDKINNLLMFDPESDHATDEQYAGFVNFVQEHDFSSNADNKKSVNSKVVHMIYGLSEEELSKVEAMKNNEDLKSEIPSLSWIDLEDVHKLKGFVNYLSGVELQFIQDFDPKYIEALKTLDDRTQFRIQEKVSQDKTELNWRQFRDKIKQHYSYEGATSNEKESFSKAS